jgi:hypothetical protein
LKPSSPTSSKRRGPRYNPDDCTGPNAASLRAALAAKAAQGEPEAKTRTAEEATDNILANFEREVAAIHAREKTATAPKPAPDAAKHAGVASGRAGAQADAGDAETRPISGKPRGHCGVYALTFQEDPEALPGEPEAKTIIFALGKTEAAIDDEERSGVLTIYTKKLAWCRAEVRSLKDQLRGTEQHSAIATAMKETTVAILAELLPMARRNAKRGKPALLRLITRAIKTKL